MVKVIVVCCQIVLWIGVQEYNLCLVEWVICEVVWCGVNVVVLFELVVSGYVFVDCGEVLVLVEICDGLSLGLWKVLVGEFDLVIVGGFCECFDLQ